MNKMSEVTKDFKVSIKGKLYAYDIDDALIRIAQHFLNICVDGTEAEPVMYDSDIEIIPNKSNIFKRKD